MWAAALSIFEKTALALGNDLSKEKSKFKTVAKSIINHPIKIIASFLMAPFLAVRMALVVKNPIRKIIAVTGLLISIILAYLSGTFLGTAAGALLVVTNVGILAGIGFLIGTSLSVFLSVCFSMVVLNSVSFLFLKLNTEEVIEYLNKIST